MRMGNHYKHFDALRLSFALCTLSMLIQLRVDAQTSINGRVVGEVVDAQGLAIYGATTSLTSQERGTKQVNHSDRSGRFEFNRVAPGHYTLSVEQSGFQRVLRTNLIVDVNATAVADVRLPVGAESVSVTVNADAPVTQSQSTELSLLVDDRRVTDLPLNGKNFNRLIYLALGVGGGDYNNPSIRGARPTANTYTLDGEDTSDERSTGGIAVDGGAGSTTYGGLGPNLISTEAISEFRVITSNADATFGRDSGGQINIIAHGGTNKFHGSIYEFIRNSALDARDYFNLGPFFTATGAPKVPPFKQNLFGGTLGGPIRHYKDFFFGNYEGFRQRLQQSSSASIPNASLVSVIPGDLGRYFKAFYIDRRIVPSVGNPAGTFSPLTTQVRIAALSAGFPATVFDGNMENGEAGTVLVSTSPTRNINQDQFLVRTDHQLTSKLSLSVRYGFAQPQPNSASAAAPIDLVTDKRRWQSGEADFVYTLTPAQTLEFRGGVLRTAFATGNTAGATPGLLALGVSPTLGLAFTFDTGLAAPITTAVSSFIDNQTVPQLSLLHSLTKGRLTLRSGVDVRRLDLNVANSSGAQPIYTDSGYVGNGGLLGPVFGETQSIAASARLVAFTNNAIAIRGWRDTQQEYFAQADYRLRKDITLNLGVRHSGFGVYTETAESPATCTHLTAEEHWT